MERRMCEEGGGRRKEVKCTAGRRCGGVCRYGGYVLAEIRANI